MVVPAEYDIIIYEGSDFALSITWKDDNDALVDLTGFTGRMHIRDKVNSVAYVDITPYVSLGTTNGLVTINIPASATIDWAFTTGVYDLEVESSAGAISRLIQGTITIDEEVTR